MNGGDGGEDEEEEEESSSEEEESSKEEMEESGEEGEMAPLPPRVRTTLVVIMVARDELVGCYRGGYG